MTNTYYIVVSLYNLKPIQDEHGSMSPRYDEDAATARIIFDTLDEAREWIDTEPWGGRWSVFQCVSPEIEITEETTRIVTEVKA